MGSFLLGKSCACEALCTFPFWGLVASSKRLFLTGMSCVDQTLKHLTAAQLPKSVCPSGILQLSIPGWCVGADVQNGLSKVGYMFFLRDDVEPGALKALRIKQQDDIVLPFLADNRKSKT